MSTLYKFYTDKGTIIHRLHPLVKFFFFATVAITSTIFNSGFFISMYIVYILIIALLAKFSWRKYHWGFLLITYVMAISVIIWPLLISGHTIFQVQTSWFTWSLNDRALDVALGLTLRMLEMYLACFIIFETTTQHEIISGLTDLGLPSHLIFGVMLTFRFVPSLIGEVGRVKEAQKARGFGGGGSIMDRIRYLFLYYQSLVVPMFSRVLRLVDELTLCLDSKGCVFTKKSARRKITLKKSDKIFIGVNACILVISLVLRAMGYGFITTW